jgi:acetoin utilization protein AcuB
MIVRDYMTKHPVMVEPAMSIVEAQGIMAETRVRHLPVVESGKRLVGLITQETLRVPPTRLTSLNVWEITRYLSNLTVKDVMIDGKMVITIGADITIEEAARVMVNHKIGCLPVLEDGVVIGIITDTDMMMHLIEMLDAPQPSVRVTMRMSLAKGELARLVNAVSAQGWGIWALSGVFSPKDPEKWDAVFKIVDATPAQVVEVLSKVEGQEIIDVRRVEAGISR